MTLAELGAVLNFAIVMAFVYLVLSVAAAMLVEMVVGRLRLRNQALKRRLSQVFDSVVDSTTVAGDVGKKFVEDLFKSPLIQGLTPGTQPTDTPANIPAQTFAQAVLAKATANQNLPQVIKDLLAAEGLSVADAVGAKAAQAKAAITLWYAEIEQRIQGEYLKRSSWWLGLAGFALAAGFNVDSIDMTRAIWSNRLALDATVARIADLQGRIAVAVDQSGADVTQVLEGNRALKEEFFALAQSDSALQALQLPVGWPMRDLDCEAGQARGDPVPAVPGPGGADTCRSPIEVLYDSMAWPGGAVALLKVLGWLITALAVMPGAKFWLDILGQAIAIRASARPKPAAEG